MDPGALSMGAWESHSRGWTPWRSRLLITFYLVAALHGAQSLDGPKDYRQKFKVGREDFVISMPVDQKHLTVARGSRAWRQVSSSEKLGSNISQSYGTVGTGSARGCLCCHLHAASSLGHPECARCCVIWTSTLALALSSTACIFGCQ